MSRFLAVEPLLRMVRELIADEARVPVSLIEPGSSIFSFGLGSEEIHSIADSLGQQLSLKGTLPIDDMLRGEGDTTVAKFTELAFVMQAPPA